MLKKDLYNIRFAIILIILYCVFMQLQFGTVCPLKGFLGINCPACGLTHATLYLITGRIDLAIQSNPTVFLWLPIIFLWILDRYIYRLKIKIFPILFIIPGLVTIIWYCI